MLHESQRWGGYLGAWVGLALALVAGTTLGTLAGARARVASLDRPRPLPDGRGASLSDRLASMDAAIARGDRTRAIYEWRDAYGLALKTREWEPMVRVGDAAARIGALASLPTLEPSGFRAEARQAYLLALFRARDAGARDGIERVAAAFTALGDADMAARARTIVVKVAP